MEVDRDAPSSSSTSSSLNIVTTSTNNAASSSWLPKTPATYFFLVSLFLICAFLSIGWNDISTFAGDSVSFSFSMLSNKNSTISYLKRDAYTINCTSSNMNMTCPANYSKKLNFTTASNETCPEYFRWIHEDLKTWKDHGINREMVESLTDVAHFRLVIVNGTAYVKQFAKSFQTRDTSTLWGILQLLKLYPGKLSDLDLMFHCNDEAWIEKDKYRGDYAAFTPPQFRYRGDNSAFDIVFPDWSFWGWPEINMKPWVPSMKDLEEGNKLNWTSKENFAFWKGNLKSGPGMKLKDCDNRTHRHVQIIDQDWGLESRSGFPSSVLSKQCAHRYKIYIEDNTWSISEKYILACDAITLRVLSVYYEFFSRSLIPMKHFWPINPSKLCESIDFAVEWGNNNTEKAQQMGKEGSEFIFSQVKMEHVYDYMFHLLNEYAKLLKYKPTIPDGAIELCSEKFACSPPGPETTFKMETLVNGPAERGPCTLPPLYDPKTLQTLMDQNAKMTDLVGMLEGTNG